MPRLFRRLTLLVLTVLTLLSVQGMPCAADILYVNNLKGSDAFDGRSPNPSSNTTGPTKTISRALHLAHKGDTIVVSNTGRAYYESITLNGSRHGGVEGQPLTIVGNGAVVDGSRAVPPQAWRRVGKRLWKFTPWRKGYFQLILNGKPVPEFRPDPVPKKLPQIPEGQWLAWRGAIYYSEAERENPAERPFRYAARSVGITLYDVESVQILDLTLRYFRLDGLNAHDRCRFTTVENVQTLDNGRSGMAVGGSSAVIIRNCDLTGNRVHSLLLFELGAAKVEDANLDRPPTVPE